MNVKQLVFRNLATNTFMPEFDYIGYKFSFKTVFYISDLEYCLCTCGYEHEYLTYISESGKIDENLYAKVELCILAGKCPHVDSASHDYIEEAGIYGVNIAAAVGTQNAFTNLGDQLRYFRRYGHVRKSSLFRLGPFETAIIIRNPKFATIPFMKEFTFKRFPVTYISAHLLNEDQQSIVFEYTTSLETCVRIGDMDLLKNCLKFNTLHRNPVAVFEYTCKHNLKEIQKFLLKRLGWNDYGHFSYLAEACKFAIIYNQPKILDKLLKYLPRNFKEENKFKCKISKLGFILNRTSCLVVLKKYAFPQHSYGPVASCVKLLIKLLDNGKIRKEVIEILQNLPDSSAMLTSARSNYTGTVLHYYIYKRLEEKFDSKEYDFKNQDPDTCYVMKTLIDLDPDDINCEDSLGMTPLTYLLHRLVDYNQVVRQCVEVILFENPEIKPDARPDLSPITLALRLDSLMGITKSSEVIPVLNGGFVADGQRYGLFGHDNRDDFVLNFYVPLLIESGFPMSEEPINRLLFKNEPLSSVERDYILENLTTPRSLNLWCRDALRKAYKGRQIHNFVAKTDMPKAIKDYILLKPLLKCVPENRILRYTTPLQKP